MQDRHHTTLAPIAGDAGHKLGSSYLGGYSAPYEMQPNKDKGKLRAHAPTKNKGKQRVPVGWVKKNN